MKVFWSWQSDHDEKISHYFVRDALSDAIKDLKVQTSLEEPSEADRRAQLHLDHDTQNRTGWVDIALAIFEKIEKSAVFIVDVTPVAESKSKKDKDGNETGLRAIMNPNVAIELGYALKALDWPKIVPIMNTAYGSIDRMPFDVDRTRRWAVTYDLKEGASNTEIKAARKKLADEFVYILKSFMGDPPKAVPFNETPPKIGKGLFFVDGQTLAVLKKHPGSMGKEVHLTFSDRSYMYLRMIPTTPLPLPLSEGMLKNTIGSYSTFGGGPSLIQENAYGWAMSDYDVEKASIKCMTQYIRNGEIWGINAEIIKCGDRKDELWLEAMLVENLLLTAGCIYAEFMRMHSKVPPPVRAEAGLVGVKGRRLVYTGGIYETLGKMYEDVEYSALLPDLAEKTINDFAKNFAVKMHNASGTPRRPGLFNRW